MYRGAREEEGKKKERKREAKYFSESTFMLGRAWGDWIIGDYSAKLLGNILLRDSPNLLTNTFSM